MNSKIRCVCVVVSSLFCSVFLSAKDEEEVRLSLTISEETEVEKLVSSFVRREVRSLGDVSITQNEPELLLMMLVTETGPTGEIVLSISVSRTSDQMFLGIPLCYPPTLMVRSTTRNSLKNTCEELVATLDNKYLDPLRAKTTDEIYEQFQRTKRKIEQGSRE